MDSSLYVMVLNSFQGTIYGRKHRMRWGVERKLSSEQYTNEIEITKVYIDSSKSLLTISTVFITASLAIAQYLKWFETPHLCAYGSSLSLLGFEYDFWSYVSCGISWSSRDIRRI